ncbi:hypothetical protein [Streptomyces anulatus]|nr:hypothetical protein OG274_00130 [Streptomyces anulatus]
MTKNIEAPPGTVGRIIHRSLRFQGKLGEETVDALLDMALPPSANPSES